MSNLNGLGENIKAIEELRSKFKDFEFPKINTEIFNHKIDIVNPSEIYSKFDFSDFKNPLVELAEEQNDSLKTLVKYNEDISRYNRDLVSLNEKILNKINSLDDTLIFLNEAFSDKTRNDEEYFKQHMTLLLELTKIIEDKDSNKLQAFVNNLGAPVLVEVIIMFFKLKFGITV